MNTGTEEKRISLTRHELARIIVDSFGEINTGSDLFPFIDRVFEITTKDGIVIFDPHGKPGERFRPGILPDLNYRCDLCNQLTKGKDGRVTDDDIFVCRWCRSAEMNGDIHPKEGDKGCY